MWGTGQSRQVRRGALALCTRETPFTDCTTPQRGAGASAACAARVESTSELAQSVTSFRYSRITTGTDVGGR
jgi:hypothetical protein